jgi:hypothetical protein
MSCKYRHVKMSIMGMKLGLSCEVENIHLTPHTIVQRMLALFMAVEKFMESCFTQR